MLGDAVLCKGAPSEMGTSGAEKNPSRDVLTGAEASKTTGCALLVVGSVGISLSLAWETLKQPSPGKALALFSFWLLLGAVLVRPKTLSTDTRAGGETSPSSLRLIVYTLFGAAIMNALYRQWGAGVLFDESTVQLFGVLLGAKAVQKLGEATTKKSTKDRPTERLDAPSPPNRSVGSVVKE